MLLEKYAPKTSKDIIGNKLAIAQLSHFLGHWEKGRAAIVAGPAGTGKTLAARLLAKELGYEIVEVGADQARGYKDMEFLLRAARQSGLAARRKLFLIDEIDQLESFQAVTELINKSGHPVVLITNEAYDSKLRAVRQVCTAIKFSRVRADAVARFLRDVCKKEGLDADAKKLEQLADTSNGDVRAALIDLETLCAGSPDISHIGYRERTQNVFETLKIIFKTTSMENALLALGNSNEPEDLHRWVAENVAEEYEDIEDIARAYDALSKADIFYSRIIRRQSWSLQRYFFELSTAGVALAKKQHYSKFVKYARPRYYRKNSEAMQKIAGRLHVSARKAVAYRALIKRMASARMLAELGLSKEEMKGL